MSSYSKIDARGNIIHYKNGTSIIHREDGPAIEWVDEDKQWYINGKPHRLDGPAIEFSNGDKLWYYNGRLIDCNSKEEFERMFKLKAFW